MSQYAQIRESLVPLRAGAAHSAEMISEFLFGEAVEIVSRHLGWLEVMGIEDGYIGFVPSSACAPILQKLPQIEPYFVQPALAEARVTGKNGAERKLWLPRGARLPYPILLANGVTGFELEDDLYQMATTDLAPAPKFTVNGIIATAITYLGAPYRWGGRSPLGIDCSGFTQMVFRLHGRSLPRNSSQQALQGRRVAWGKRHAGDLAFFKNRLGRIVHVGILLGPDQIIHASGRVRVDNLNEAGIIHSSNKSLTHQLDFIQTFD